MNNLHISLTDFRNESRVIKEIISLRDAKLFSKFYVAALHEDGLEHKKKYDENIFIQRFSLTTRKYGKNIIAQFVKYIEFCVKILFFYKKRNISCINVHCLGLLPLGVFLKYLWGASLVYDAHELETETNGAHGVRKKLSKWLEYFFIKHADMTIVVSESIADWYSSEYYLKRPLVVFNAPNLHELKKNNNFREELGIRENQIILLYQGGLIAGRGVRLILNAFKARKEKDVVAVFMGYGELQEEIKTAANQYGNIFFYPAVSQKVLIEYTSSADFGIHLIQKTCLNHDYCMPNKLFEYAMAGLPVLVSDMKDMSELVEKNKMGVVISDFSVAGINRAINNFLAQDLKKMKINAYRVACEHAWEVQEQKMLSAYKDIGWKNSKKEENK